LHAKKLKCKLWLWLEKILVILYFYYFCFKNQKPRTKGTTMHNNNIFILYNCDDNKTWACAKNGDQNDIVKKLGLHVATHYQMIVFLLIMFPFDYQSFIIIYVNVKFYFN
jgi:hypothetical protein